MGDEGPPARTSPRRAIAVVLGLIGPMGVGQGYLGHTKRGACWLALYSVALAGLAFALAPLGAMFGYGKTFTLIVLGFVVAWTASLVDVARLGDARPTRSRWVAVVVFWAAGAVLSLALRGIIRGHALEAFKIPSGSMQPTLLVNEHLIADKRALRRSLPKRGDAIIFAAREQPEADFIKRVVAVPGDTLELKSGHPWLNGWEVPHCLVGTATLPDARPGWSGTVELAGLVRWARRWLALREHQGAGALPLVHSVGLVALRDVAHRSAPAGVDAGTSP